MDWKEAISSPLVRTTLVFSSGVAITVAFLGNPQILTQEASADWASAIGSFAAAIVALALGVTGILQGQHQERERQRNASVVFLGPVQVSLAALETTNDQKADVLSNISTSIHFKSILESIPALITPETLPYMVHLPSETAKRVMLASQQREIVQARLKLLTTAGIGPSVMRAEADLTKAYLPLANMLQHQAFSGAAGPWRQR